MQLKKLRILTYNVNSLYSLEKRTSFNLFMKQNNPDIALISETNVSRRNNIDIAGFKTFRNDKTEDRRGTAVYIKNKIHPNAFETTITGFLTSEATAATIRLGRDDETLTVISVYFKCSSNRSDILKDLHVLNSVLERSTYGLIGGDFNARHLRWLDTTTNGEGKAIADWMDDNSDEHRLVVISQPKPTFPRTPSTLDFFLVTSNLVHILPELQNYICTILPSYSDHEAVQLTIQLRRFINLEPETRERVINYRKLDVERLQRDIEDNVELPPRDRNLGNSEIDNAVNNLEVIVRNALDIQKQPRTSKDRYQHLPEYVQKLYSHRQRLRKRLQRIHHRELNRVNSDYQTVLSELNCINIMFRNSIQHHNNIQFQNRLQTIKPGPDAFRNINRLIGKNPPLPERIISSNGEATSAQGKAEAFAEHFEGNFTPNPPADPGFLLEIDASIQQTLRPNPDQITFSNANPASDPVNCPQLCTPEQITEIIHNLKPKKSAGLDGISNFILKRLPNIIMIFLAIIMNNCINNGYFPQNWKTAKIVAIPKKGSSNLVTNYRPISLLSNLSKILEELTLRKLKDYCREHQLIPDMQFGFRESHSTLHPLLKFQHDVTIALNSHRCTVGCFLDVEKAFDSVWVEALIHKLNLLNFPQPLIKIIFSFLSSRKFYVQIENAKSTVKSIRAGVAQGSKLGPFLYNILTSDQPKPSECENLLYADDSLTYASSMSPLIACQKVEAHLRKLFDFYKKWGIKINTGKSELVCFRRPSYGRTSRSAGRCRSLVLRLPDGTSIAAKRCVKYLGINFNELLRFNPHTKAVLKKANFAFHRLHPLLRKRNGLSQKTKLLIYKQLIRPIIGYSFPVWYSISKTAMKKLAVFERKILRICTGLYFDQQRNKHYKNEQLYSEAKLIPLERYLLQAAKRILGNIANHPNQLIRRMTNQERHPEPRYLSAMEILEEDVIPTINEEAVNFYADPGSAHHRG